MSAEKFSASMEDALLADARAAAEAEGLTFSSWLAAAAADRLRLKKLRKLVIDWEVEHGVITTAELDALEVKVAAARRAAGTRSSRARTTDASQQAAS